MGARGRLSAVRKPPPKSSTPKTPQEQLKRNEAIKKFMTIPGLGSVNPSPSPGPSRINARFRKKSAEALYDAGCETVERLQLKKYKEVLSPGAKRGLKYLKHLESPVPRGNAEAIAVRRCSRFDYKPKTNVRRNFAGILYRWMGAKSSSLVTSKSTIGNQRFPLPDVLGWIAGGTHQRSQGPSNSSSSINLLPTPSRLPPTHPP